MSALIANLLAVLSISIIIAVSISPVWSCTCQKRHPQQYVCDANFVFRGKVLGKSPFQSATSLPGQFEYQIQVQRVFKDQVDGGIGRKVKLITPASEALCGVPELTQSKTYLITGEVIDGQMYLSVCNWVAEWQSVTRPQRQGIKHLYMKHCTNCMVRIESPSPVSHPLPQGPLDYFHGCTYTSYTHLSIGIADCEASYASCVQNHNRGCGWLSNHGYQECLEKRNVVLQQLTDNQKFHLNAIDHGGNW
ncbi:metalloproteinase inhibitor 3-like [Acanthaster planci]|uniref:Metalloproteinase inhibitor 3-like n=1 Tax=Acanthaster planci TaxID=133434 RepID=A0A8B7YZL5_ACAPL|nr:metalloproteinase inhibitor 3-like [Acanthaster planci]